MSVSTGSVGTKCEVVVLQDGKVVLPPELPKCPLCGRLTIPIMDYKGVAGISNACGNVVCKNFRLAVDGEHKGE